MIKRTITVIVLCQIWLLTGCYVQSLNKFYTDDLKVESPQILGDWNLKIQMGDDVSNKKIASWKFTGENIETYDEENIYSKLDVAYFKVADNHFIDLTAGEPKFKTNFYWGAGLTLVHSLCKIKIDKDTLTITPLDIEWFTDKIKNKQLNISYVKAIHKDSNYIFTPTPKEWVAFLRKHGNDPDLFNEKYSFVFKKKK